jgi:hypothetical protein
MNQMNATPTMIASKGGELQRILGGHKNAVNEDFMPLEMSGSNTP